MMCTSSSAAARAFSSLGVKRTERRAVWVVLQQVVMGRGSVVIFTASGSAYIPFLQQAFSTVGLAPAIGCSARRWAARVVAAPVEQGDYAKDKPLQLGQSMRDTWSIDI